MKHDTSKANPELQLAMTLIEQTGTSIFLTGKAGTGKTTFLRTLMSKLPKRMVVLAPTGIAAINAGGMTIHSFFQLPTAPYLPGMAYGGEAKYRYRFSKNKVNILRSLDLLVIDEVSMVRADLLDSVDDVLRRYKDREKPFGGVQLLLIGDIQQLPPVVKDDEWELLSKYYDSPYFFSSLALKQIDYCTIELKKVYRQSDSAFLDILNAIRENRCNASILAQLNQRCLPRFNPANEEGYIHLATHNYQAQHINERNLQALTTRSVRYKAKITGDFPTYSYPTDAELELKQGAQVMFIKNDMTGQHRYANGTIGVVKMLTNAGIQVVVDQTNEVVDVEKETWTNAKYKLNETTKEIEEEIEGEFTQYPLRLAWAITVHKSQGLTFDKAIIDVSAAFAHGQTYVALSRCRTLEGLVLSAPIPGRALISDARVNDFIVRSTANIPDAHRCHDLQRAYFGHLLDELFGFSKLYYSVSAYQRLLDEYFYQTYPVLLQQTKDELDRIKAELVDVSRKFKSQYDRIIATSADYTVDTTLQERIHSAASYFFVHIQPLITLLSMAHPDTDNRTIEKRFRSVDDNMRFDVQVKVNLLMYVRDHGFRVTDYLRQKALLNIKDDALAATSSTRRSKASKAKSTGPVTADEIMHKFGRSQQPGASLSTRTAAGTADIHNMVLFEALREWRNQKAKELGKPSYIVLQQKALIGIANAEPHTLEALGAVPYVGKYTLTNYGEELLQLVKKYS